MSQARCVLALIAAALLVYSQTAAFAWDEGFHLLAAQLIAGGKRPYLDFFFPQTPLNAYWNAAWMKVFGDTWRTAHAVAALCTAGAVVLTANFAFARFGAAGALVAALAMGLNAMVFTYGAVGQAYGLCLLLIVAAFRLSIVAVERTAWLWAAAAGLCAVGAAASSLLTAPVAPVLLLWILFQNRAGSRLAKLAAFMAGGAISLLPLLWLFAQSPREVFFEVIQYNSRYRAVGWSDTIEHNVGVLLSWIDSSQALALGLLAAGGLLFVARKSGWNRARRAEFYLCGWLAALLGLHISTARPTFERYYLLLTPFLAILAATGIHAVASRLNFAHGPVILTAALLALGLAKALYNDYGAFSWSDFEQIAAKAAHVTPPSATMWADEHVYFLTRRAPPSGMEHENSHKPLPLPPDFIAALHIIPRPELERQVAAGRFDTIVTCADESKVAELGLSRIYAQRADVSDCAVFWDKRELQLR